MDGAKACLYDPIFHKDLGFDPAFLRAATKNSLLLKTFSLHSLTLSRIRFAASSSDLGYTSASTSESIECRAYTWACNIRFWRNTSLNNSLEVKAAVRSIFSVMLGMIDFLMISNYLKIVHGAH